MGGGGGREEMINSPSYNTTIPIILQSGGRQEGNVYSRSRKLVLPSVNREEYSLEPIQNGNRHGSPAD